MPAGAGHHALQKSSFRPSFTLKDHSGRAVHFEVRPCNDKGMGLYCLGYGRHSFKKFDHAYGGELQGYEPRVLLWHARLSFTLTIEISCEGFVHLLNGAMFVQVLRRAPDLPISDYLSASSSYAGGSFVEYNQN